jgi:hypothetical protein
MTLYICYRLNYTRHRLGSETFEAKTDEAACAAAAKLAKAQGWVDRELWDGARRVVC